MDETTAARDISMRLWKAMNDFLVGFAMDRTRFPEINGVGGCSLHPDQLDAALRGELNRADIQLCMTIISERELTDEQKQEIRRAFAEKFVKREMVASTAAIPVDTLDDDRVRLVAQMHRFLARCVKHPRGKDYGAAMLITSDAFVLLAHEEAGTTPETFQWDIKIFAEHFIQFMAVGKISLLETQ